MTVLSPEMVTNVEQVTIAQGYSLMLGRYTSSDVGA